MDAVTKTGILLVNGPNYRNGELHRELSSPDCSCAFHVVPEPHWHRCPKHEGEALFALGEFLLHSGEKSAWKIECDALTRKDWNTLAYMVYERFGPFDHAIGVPTGGFPFAESLNRMFATYNGEHKVLIVDDVLTTGNSFEAMRRRLLVPGSGYTPERIQGVAVFARGRTPEWVQAIMTVWG